MEKLLEFANARGYEVFSQYEDVVSGADKRRPELHRLMIDAKNRKFDKVIATKVDRLGRSVIHLQQVFLDLERWGVQIEITDQPIDTSTPMGKFTTTILGAVAEFERDLIQERTRDGLSRTVAAGTKLGRPKKDLTPYQIAKTKKLLEENPDISLTKLASNFEGISRNTYLGLAFKAGLITRQKTGSSGVYKETPKNCDVNNRTIIDGNGNSCYGCLEHDCEGCDFWNAHVNKGEV